MLIFLTVHSNVAIVDFWAQLLKSLLYYQFPLVCEVKAVFNWISEQQLCQMLKQINQISEEMKWHEVVTVIALSGL